MISVLTFILFFWVYSAVAVEQFNDESKGSDVRISLMFHSDDVKKKIAVEEYEENCCGNFFYFLTKLFSSKNDNPVLKLKVERENFFPTFPRELIVYIENFLDPPSVISLALTCEEAQGIYSNTYWEYKCQKKKLRPWKKEISPAMVYVANFWYQTHQLAMLKKAASIGHPESKRALESRKAQTSTKEMKFVVTYPDLYYTDQNWRFMSFKMRGSSYYH